MQRVCKNLNQLGFEHSTSPNVFALTANHIRPGWLDK
uniref:Uncharacterized protein n=1 Tax=Rhizophora mucronata TaxID=61149 RepID=A0A2P2NCV6_RHIMU